ncbi:restriction endonuclease subunit S [uncultured Psychrobacter sp.]|uniref:restriction endonuclease subunit S n=1 Tax=uncultured Psychrobacter sp. TaxID=259303 RepID=UPI0026385BB0|nr:restriction endonuclease subunit S [uncultured Psychrobacter sp.]
MAKYQQYEEYKESGVEWLGKIPKNWSTISLKRKASFITGMTPSTAISEYYSDDVTIYEWVRPEDIKEESEEVNGSKYLTELGWKTQKKIAENSVLLCCIGTIGKAAYTSKVVTTNQQITAISFKDDSKYNYYLLLAARNELEQMATGNVVKILNSERLGRLVIPNLELFQANSIANFLDHETAKIDTLIEKQQTLIQLLKEKRQAVISHAVTKGLNPDAPMKDSGVEWLGEVPEHWEVGRLKNVLRIRNGRDYKEVEVESGGYPVYGSGGIFKRSSDYLFDGESVLFGRKGTVDKPLLVSGKFWTVDTMFYSEASSNAKPNYIYHQALLFPFDQLSTNTALPSMTQENLLELGFVIPPFDEQEQICQYLSDKLKVFSNLVSKAEKAIQLMQERRTALISAAVTGKIDVRGWRASE